MPQLLEETCLITKLLINPASVNNFADWQARINSVIASFPGFLSLEISAPKEPQQPGWVIVQRFHTSDDVSAWQISKERLDLLEELKPMLAKGGVNAIREEKKVGFDKEGYVTEVFVTQVNPAKKDIYNKWMSKIHQVEAKFPGFQGVYVQSPKEGENWITLLQFDTTENLDRWLNSPERQKVLDESKSLIDSLETHRVMSPYAGWFASVSKGGEAPPVWKQTMLILLVLFPIVMLELKFLNPWTNLLNPSLGTFIGNAISVTLVSWPTLPFAIWSLRWWLTPEGNRDFKTTLKGTFIVLGLYLLEIALLWKLM